LGQYQRAIEFHQQSLDIKREIGDRGGEANSLGSLGIAYARLKQYGKAIDLQEQCLAIRCEIGDRHGEGYSLQSLAQSYQACGRVREGFAAAQAATQIFQELELPLEVWTSPNWIKSFIKFAQRGKWHLVTCFIVGFLAFPFLLAFILTITLWRFTFGRFRR